MASEEPDYEVQVKEASDRMSKKLPAYVVESFLEAGYETLDSIAEMDITSKGNSIEEIETFITNEFVDDPRFSRGRTKTGNFRYLLGHKSSIINFIKQIKEEKEIFRTKKRCNADKDNLKPLKKAKHCREGETSDDLPAVYSHVRKQVVKWQKKQENEHIKQLKEEEQYEVCVKLRDDSSCIASIKCKLCMKDYTLGRSNGKPVISNWTKHVIKCLKQQKSAPTCATSIHRFFPRACSELILSQEPEQNDDQQDPDENRYLNFSQDLEESINSNNPQGQESSHFRLAPPS